MSEFERLVADYREGPVATLVRRPDLGDVARRAHRIRRRQVVGSVTSATLVIGGVFAGAQTLMHDPAPPVVPVAVHLVPATGEPHFLAQTTIDMPVAHGVAGKDALWFVGRAKDAWQLVKVTAPDVTVSLRVALAGEPVGVAATKRYIWVALTKPDGSEVVQYDAEGNELASYNLSAPPLSVHGTDVGTAWVTESTDTGVRVVRLDGDKRMITSSSAGSVAGEAGVEPVTLANDKLIVTTTVDGDNRVTLLGSKSLAALPAYTPLDFGNSPVLDVAYTDPVFFAAATGDRRGFWMTPTNKLAQGDLQQLSDLPTYKVTTTQEHAWALSDGPSGGVISRFDVATGAIGATVPTPVNPRDVSVMVADLHYVWLVSGNEITVFGPS